jgi:hypothetical protein
MTARSDTLICRAEAPIGPDALLGWSEYSLSANPHFFRRQRDGQVGALVPGAAAGAIERGFDLTVWWGEADLWSMPAAKLEAIFRQLRPAVLVCPERPGVTDRWTIVSLDIGAPDSLPGAAAPRAVSEQVQALYPTWHHGAAWNATAFLLRHDVSAEELGIVPPLPPSPNDVVASVSDDPQVGDATLRADPSIPSTIRDLVPYVIESDAVF